MCRRQTSHELKTLCCTRYSMINFKKEYLIDSFVHYSLSSPGFLVPAFLAPFLTKCVRPSLCFTYGCACKLVERIFCPLFPNHVVLFVVSSSVDRDI